MLKSLLIGACLVVSLVACSTGPGTRTDAKMASAAGHESCVQDTGTRIPRRDHECAAFGRSYSHEDIQRTGAVTVGEALRLLDPSITTTGH
jgi:hypothetical protein